MEVISKLINRVYNEKLKTCLKSITDYYHLFVSI